MNGKDLRTSILKVAKNFSTEQLFVELVYNGHVPRIPQILVASIIFTVVGTITAFLLMPQHALIISIFLTALGLQPTFSLLIQREQAQDNPSVPQTRQSRIKAQLRLATGLLGIFIGVMTVYAVAVLTTSQEFMLNHFGMHLTPYLAMYAPNYQPHQLDDIFFNNLLVALVTLVLTILYRTGGALLILIWNASLWGIVFAYFSRPQSVEHLTFSSAITFAKLMAAVLPHTFLETLSYIVAVLAGLIFHRILAQKIRTSAGLIQAARQLASLLLASLILVRIAAIVEVSLAPSLLNALNLIPR